jgi:folate-binding protein YgfZ
MADAADYALRLPGMRYQLVFSDTERAVGLWQRLRSAGAQVGTGAAWQWASVGSGIAEIVAETQDQFVLQMLNYDLLGGVSFTKGCYPGQEIVARSQYRGEIKRRTLLLHAQTEDAPVPAQPVYAVRSTPQPVGTVLGAAAAPGGGFDVLACVHLDLAENSELRLDRADGAALERLELPYALPASR